jgi:hypothetical protein
VLTILVAAGLLQSSQVIAIQNVTVIEPGKTQVRSHCTVVIDHGIFSQVGDSAKIRVPVGSRLIDGTGKFLIPGLWDMHVHPAVETDLGLFTANGVTGIRIMAGVPMYFQWREKVAKAELLGPTMFIASPVVDGKNPIGKSSLALPLGGDARALVSKLKAQGWDFIKTYDVLTRESYLALAAEAKAQKIPFAGHVPFSVNPVEAAKNGQRSMEHLSGILESCFKGEPEFRAKLQVAMRAEGPYFAAVDRVATELGPEKLAYDPERAQKLCEDLGKTKMWQCPTLIGTRALAHADELTNTPDERMRYVTLQTRERWKLTNEKDIKGASKEAWDDWKEQCQERFELVLPLKKAGSRFLAGTDSQVPFCYFGFSLHDELALLVEAGFTPTEALETATVNPARFFGEERKWGTIGKGKRADAVLLDRNPLVDIHNTTAIRAVVQSGRVLNRDELDAILKASEDRP